MNDNDMDDNLCLLSLQLSVKVGGTNTTTNHQQEHCRLVGIGLWKEQRAMKKGRTMLTRRTSEEEEDEDINKEEDCAATAVAAATATTACHHRPPPQAATTGRHHKPPQQATTPALPLLCLFKQWQQWLQHGVAACGGV